MPVAAIVPAFDASARIAGTVDALRSVAAIDEIIVVDDGSSDDTAARAQAAGATVIRLPVNAGKGAALRAGVASTSAEILCFIDADLGPSARAAATLLHPVIEGDADMTIAAPPPSGPSGFGLVERAARWGIRVLAGADMRRPLSGQRALRRAVVDRCAIAERFGVETALTIDAVRAGFRVLEITVEIRHARTGRTLAGFSHRARQGAAVAGVLLSRVLNKRR